MPGAGGALATGGTSATGGISATGGASGVGGAGGTGGAARDAFVPWLDAGVGGSGTGGSRVTGGVVGSGGAAAGGSSSGGVSGQGGAAAGGSGTGGKVADAGIDGTIDGTIDGAIDGAIDAFSLRPDTLSADLPLGAGFDTVLGGTWLVGWAGGARHYSWVRLGASPSGTAEFLSGADLGSNIPFWDCEGVGSWFLTAAPYSIMLRFPSSCPDGLPAYFTFQGLPDTTPRMPGATFGMVAPSVTSSSSPMTEWWKFPDGQCDATMSSCKKPFS